MRGDPSATRGVAHACPGLLANHYVQRPRAPRSVNCLCPRLSPRAVGGMVCPPTTSSERVQPASETRASEACPRAHYPPTASLRPADKFAQARLIMPHVRRLHNAHEDGWMTREGRDATANPRAIAHAALKIRPVPAMLPCGAPCQGPWPMMSKHTCARAFQFLLGVYAGRRPHGQSAGRHTCTRFRII